MTDISKCSGNGCDIKDNCLRYTEPTNNLYQSWIAPEYKPEKKDCWNLLRRWRG